MHRYGVFYYLLAAVCFAWNLAGGKIPLALVQFLRNFGLAVLALGFYLDSGSPDQKPRAGYASAEGL